MHSLISAMISFLRGQCEPSCSEMQLTDSIATKGTVRLARVIGKAHGSMIANINVLTGITVRKVVEAVGSPSAHGVWDAGQTHQKKECKNGVLGVIEEMEKKYG